MANNVNSMSFLLTAIIDGEDAVSLDISPSSIVWNQEGDVSVDAQGNTVDNSSWPVQYITASVRKGDADESGWLYDYTIGSGCSFDVHKGTLSADGKFTVDTNGNTFELSSPRKTKDASGKEAENLWTNGSIRITATKNGMKISKDAGIILNALATWKLSVINGTVTATSSKVETQVDGKITTIQSEIKQKEDEIKLGISSRRLYRNLLKGTDFSYIPDNMSFLPHDDKNVVEITDSVLYDSDKTLHIKTATKGVFDGVYFRPITIKSQTDYTISVWAKGKGTITIETEYNDDSGNRIWVEMSGEVNLVLTDEWKLYRARFTSDEHTKLEVNFYGYLDTGEAWIAHPMLEESSEYTGWTLSPDDPTTEDRLRETGIDITKGTVDLIAGLCNFVGKDGKPYIKVAQDSKGYPHLIFMDPELNIEAYDLGWTGLSQIVESSEKLTFPPFAGGNFFAQTLGMTAEISVWDLAYEYYMTYRLDMFQFHPASFVNKKGTKIYVPAEAESLQNKLYSSNTVNDGLPLGKLIADGWYLQVSGYGAASRGRAVGYTADGVKIVNMGKDDPNYVYYDAILVVNNRPLYNTSFKIETWAVHGSMKTPAITSADGLGLDVVIKDGEDEKGAINFDKSAQTLTLKKVS